MSPCELGRANVLVAATYDMAVVLKRSRVGRNLERSLTCAYIRNLLTRDYGHCLPHNSTHLHAFDAMVGIYVQEWHVKFH